MKKVLFTKKISSEFLRKSLTHEIEFDVVNFLEIKIHPIEKITPQIDKNINNYLITSQNSVKAIQELDLNGDFYVVGQKTADLLEKQGFRVKVYKNYASELAAYILENESESNWTFFCGSHRRDELFEKLTPFGHHIKEVLCYDSNPAYHDLKGGNYDGIAFFSPLGVKSYLKYNTILDETIIFTIGNTTSEEVKIHTKNKIIKALTPTVESIVESINNYFYVEK